MPKYVELDRIAEESQRGNFDQALAFMEEQRELGSVSLLYTNAHSESIPMVLHPQIIADARTVIQIINEVRPIYQLQSEPRESSFWQQHSARG